jgi:hypothetical protein
MLSRDEGFRKDNIGSVMKILWLSDIHASFEALSGNDEYDALLCLGDLVDYGPSPKECIAGSVREYFCHHAEKYELDWSHEEIDTLVEAAGGYPLWMEEIAVNAIRRWRHQWQAKPQRV